MILATDELASIVFTAIEVMNPNYTDSMLHEHPINYVEKSRIIIFDTMGINVFPLTKALLC